MIDKQEIRPAKSCVPERIAGLYSPHSSKVGFFVMEIWKEIKGYEGLYEVSNYGRVKNANGLILKPGDNGRGYMFVNLKHTGLSKSFYVHRLVCIHFLENPNNKPDVNHKDCNKSNNHVDNLEWVTKEENMRHASNNGLLYTSEYQKMRTSIANRGESQKNSKLTEDDVLEIRRLHSEGLTHKQIAMEIGKVKRQCIGYIVNRKTWRHI